MIKTGTGKIKKILDTKEVEKLFWFCPGCGMLNSPNIYKCSLCGLERKKEDGKNSSTNS